MASYAASRSGYSSKRGGGQSVYQIDFTAVASGKRIANTKRRVRWRFGLTNLEALENGQTGTACRGEEHDITLVWSIASGKRLVLADGQEVHYSNSRSSNFEFSWTMRGNHVLKIIAFASPPISTGQTGFRQYDFFVDGQSFFIFPKVYRLGLSGTEARAAEVNSKPLAVADRVRSYSRYDNPVSIIASIETPTDANEEQAYLEEAIKNSLQDVPESTPAVQENVFTQNNPPTNMQQPVQQPTQVVQRPTQVIQQPTQIVQQPTQPTPQVTQDLLLDFLSVPEPSATTPVPPPNTESVWSSRTSSTGIVPTVPPAATVPTVPFAPPVSASPGTSYMQPTSTSQYPPTYSNTYEQPPPSQSYPPHVPDTTFQQSHFAQPSTTDSFASQPPVTSHEPAPVALPTVQPAPNFLPHSSFTTTQPNGNIIGTNQPQNEVLGSSADQAIGKLMNGFSLEQNQPMKKNPFDEPTLAGLQSTKPVTEKKEVMSGAAMVLSTNQTGNWGGYYAQNEQGQHFQNSVAYPAQPQGTYNAYGMQQQQLNHYTQQPIPPNQSFTQSQSNQQQPDLQQFQNINQQSMQQQPQPGQF